MEQVIIHMIHITIPKEKHLFQITLPENVAAITGIGTTADRYKVNGIDSVKFERSAGTLQLFAADTSEHLFSDDPKNTYEASKIQRFDEFFEHKVWSYKGKAGLFDTWQPIHTTILDGYYQDLIGNVTEDIDYYLRIYLRLVLRDS
jgi:hypothetical protein